jgi:tRNA pseudouridine38-40 synthase
MRYFLTLAYRGTRYAGWQRQPNAPSVQETLEQALSTILRHPVDVTGCGRTDTGVHARYYVAHFDTELQLPSTFLYSVNSLLPPDIAVYAAAPVAADAHARFDAYERSYEYRIILRKDPFAVETDWFCPHGAELDLEKVQAVAALIPQFREFFPFCKTDSGVDSYACTIVRSDWLFEPAQHRLTFYISANRFLRGMVRLIVGACIQAGKGQLSVGDVRHALGNQTTLHKSLSVPPRGLALTGVKYPFPF